MDRPNRITRLRRHEGLTLKQLAAEIAAGVDGVTCSESTLCRWENGSRPVSDPVKLFLAERFEVSVAYLMGWTEAEENGNGGSLEQEAC